MSDVNAKNASSAVSGNVSSVGWGARASVPLRAGLFLRAAVPDFALCLAVAFGVGYAVLSGFDATVGMRDALGLQAGLCGGMLAVLFAGAWSKGARIVSVCGGVLLALAAFGIALSAMPDGVGVIADGTVNDVEGNYTVFVAVELVVSVLVYVLSRRPGSALFLAVAAVFTCAVVQYLFRGWLSEEGGLAAFLIVLCASMALEVYQRYRAGAMAADRLARPAFASAAALGLVVAALCIGGAGLAYVGIVEPLGLGTPLFKPFEYRIIHPVVEYTGTYDQLMTEDPDRFSSLLSEKAQETTENTEGGTSPQQDSTTAANNPLTSFVQSLAVFSDDSWTEAFDAVTVDQPPWMLALVALAVVAACVLVVAARVRWRAVRLRRIERKPPAQQIVCLYEFLLSRFKRLGLDKPAQSTPLEYAYDYRRRMVPFTRNTGKVDLVHVTLAYQRAAFGSGELAPDDLDKVKRYYRAFFGNAHRYVGTLRWLWKFWRI